MSFILPIIYFIPPSPRILLFLHSDLLLPSWFFCFLHNRRTCFLQTQSLDSFIFHILLFRRKSCLTRRVGVKNVSRLLKSFLGFSSTVFVDFLLLKPFEITLAIGTQRPRAHSVPSLLFGLSAPIVLFDPSVLVQNRVESAFFLFYFILSFDPFSQSLHLPVQPLRVPSSYLQAKWRLNLILLCWFQI